MSREKQIEEMIKEIEKCSCVYTPCDRECGQCSNAEMYDDTINHIARTMYEAGYRKQEWISVDERLPDRSGKYLVATFDSRIGIGNLIDYYCDGELSFDSYKVTHWMPLPEAPKMKGGAE